RAIPKPWPGRCWIWPTIESVQGAWLPPARSGSGAPMAPVPGRAGSSASMMPWRRDTTRCRVQRYSRLVPQQLGMAPVGRVDVGAGRLLFSSWVRGTAALCLLIAAIRMDQAGTLARRTPSSTNDTVSRQVLTPPAAAPGAPYSLALGAYFSLDTWDPGVV